tara:strand:+ start:396 stop:1397 length:1002 start_codon:yes stop_codon:yes gene_type:complete
MNLIKKLSINSLIFLISASLMLVFSEVLVRNLFPEFDPTDHHVHYYLNKSEVPLLKHRSSTRRQWVNSGEFDVSIYANDLGFRSRKTLQNLPANAIYVVGDSFSFGHGVEEEDRFSSLLESYSGRSVANISIPTDLYGYEKLLDYASSNSANIKKIIITICMENDILDYGERIAKKANASFKEIQPIKRIFKQRSALYNFATATIKQNRILLKVANKFGLINSSAPVIYATEVSSSIERLVSIRNKYNAEILLLIVPSRGLWGGKLTEEFDFVHRKFVKKVQARGFDTLDMRQFLEESGSPLDYHYPIDGHWNKQGHKITAEKLAKHIESIGF